MKLPLKKKLHFPLTVSACAEVLGVSPSLLRHYEEQGIVSPSRDSDGRRLYLPGDLARLKAYRAMLANDTAAIRKFREQRRRAALEE